MRSVVLEIPRRVFGLVMGLLKRNFHVYARSSLARVSWPDIPARPVELYGQRGEDLVLAALISARAMELGVDPSRERYLEVGANHPFASSPTFLLDSRLGMTGVLVEANPALLADLRKGRPAATIVHGAVQTEDRDVVALAVSAYSELSSLDGGIIEHWGERAGGVKGHLDVPALRMNQLVEDHLGGASPCLLSVDVEGLDLSLLEDFDFDKYRPWFVQAEPSDHYLPGESERMIDFMRSVDYRLVARTEINLIFADDRRRP